jgi:cystinosin
LSILFYASYVKVGCTLAKYIPQAWFNYQRKSTIGWSIENILLDLTGGVLSFAQMIMDSINSSMLSGSLSSCFVV